MWGGQQARWHAARQSGRSTGQTAGSPFRRPEGCAATKSTGRHVFLTAALLVGTQANQDFSWPARKFVSNSDRQHTPLSPGRSAALPPRWRGRKPVGLPACRHVDSAPARLAARRVSLCGLCGSLAAAYARSDSNRFKGAAPGRRAENAASRALPRRTLRSGRRAGSSGVEGRGLRGTGQQTPGSRAGNGSFLRGPGQKTPRIRLQLRGLGRC